MRVQVSFIIYANLLENCISVILQGSENSSLLQEPSIHVAPGERRANREISQSNIFLVKPGENISGKNIFLVNQGNKFLVRTGEYIPSQSRGIQTWLEHGNIFLVRTWEYIPG